MALIFGVGCGRSVILAPELAETAVDWSSGPQVLYLGAPPTRDVVTLEPPPGMLCEVRTFMGCDVGTRGEFGLDIALGGAWIYERSEHLQSGREDYDAWRHRVVRRRVEPGDKLTIAWTAQQTDVRATDGGRSTRVEFGVRVAYCAE